MKKNQLFISFIYLICISPVKVKMARIQQSDKPLPITHQNDVTVAIKKDSETNTAYLRIIVNSKVQDFFDLIRLLNVDRV